MIRILVLVLSLFVYFVNSSVQAQTQTYRYAPETNNGIRYCYNPNCRMCNMIWGPMPGYELTSDYRSVPVSKPQQIQQPFINPRPIESQIFAQPKPQPTPVLKSKIEADVELLATPMESVKAMLSLVKPKPDDWIYDLGAGDGRIVIEAAKTYGSKGVGIELNPNSARLAESNVHKNGLTNRVIIIEGNVLDYEYDAADIVTLYLYPDLLEKIVPKIKPGTLVVSANHDLPNVVTEKHVVDINNVPHEFFIWRP